jgi:hypothetical protein
MKVLLSVVAIVVEDDSWDTASCILDKVYDVSEMLSPDDEDRNRF